jgi:hypothetical protein
VSTVSAADFDIFGTVPSKPAAPTATRGTVPPLAAPTKGGMVAPPAVGLSAAAAARKQKAAASASVPIPVVKAAPKKGTKTTTDDLLDLFS